MNNVTFGCMLGSVVYASGVDCPQNMGDQPKMLKLHNNDRDILYVMSKFCMASLS